MLLSLPELFVGMQGYCRGKERGREKRLGRILQNSIPKKHSEEKRNYLRAGGEI
jgi:hypothetical protein